MLPPGAGTAGREPVDGSADGGMESTDGAPSRWVGFGLRVVVGSGSMSGGGGGVAVGADDAPGVAAGVGATVGMAVDVGVGVGGGVGAGAGVTRGPVTSTIGGRASSDAEPPQDWSR